MFNILLVEDNQEKSRKITDAIAPAIDENVKLHFAQDINSAKQTLRKINVDFLILDICLPQTFGTSVIKDGGIKLLQDIKKSKSGVYSYPKYVVSVSGYSDCTESFASTEGVIHSSIDYDDSSDAWEREICLRLQTAKDIVQSIHIRRTYDYDVAVVCALKEELDYVIEIFDNVKDINVPYDDDVYFEGTFCKDGKTCRAIATYASKIGMVATASLTTKVVTYFAPRYIVMTGITGGISKEKTGYGDIIIAEKAWDYQAGKEKKVNNERVHQNTIDQRCVDTTLIGYVRRIQESKDKVQKIKEMFTRGEKPSNELRVLIGPVVSGASVVTNPDIVEDVINNQSRDVLGIEMEIYGFYYAVSTAINPKPKFIAIKSVSDFADTNKDDNYHPYAAYTSARVFEILAKEYFDYDE